MLNKKGRFVCLQKNQVCSLKAIQAFFPEVKILGFLGTVESIGREVERIEDLYGRSEEKSKGFCLSVYLSLCI